MLDASTDKDCHHTATVRLSRRRLPPDAPAFAVAGRHRGGAAMVGAQGALDTVCPAGDTAPSRLGRQLRLPGVGHRVRIVQPADDRTRKSRLVGLAFVCAPVDGCDHIAATIYHHFVRRDGVLMRMITG